MRHFGIYFFILVIFFFLKSDCYADKGDVFYKEDFLKVKDGHLPKGWVGGEKLIVNSSKGKKFLIAFEEGNHSVIINNIKYPKNFEIRIIGYKQFYQNFKLKVGTATFGFNTYEFFLNKSKKEGGIKGRGFVAVFRKEGPVLTFQLAGFKPVVVRDSKFRISDTFIIEILVYKVEEDDSRIYEIKMTDLGE